jgi:prepilin-type N-terminal cleavage/methylation domain-containing protein
MVGSPQYGYKRKGFTLAELLVAMSVFGIISTFSISKGITAYNNSVKKALLKETFSTFNGALHELMLEGTIRFHPVGQSNFPVRKFLEKLNALKICEVHAFNEGCVSDASQVDQGGRLPNGVEVGIKVGYYIDIFIDYNGNKGPNIIGDDQLMVYYNDMDVDAWGRRPGQMNAGPLDPQGVPNYDLYVSLFK